MEYQVTPQEYAEMNGVADLIQDPKVKEYAEISRREVVHILDRIHVQLTKLESNSLLALPFAPIRPPGLRDSEVLAEYAEHGDLLAATYDSLYKYHHHLKTLVMALREYQEFVGWKPAAAPNGERVDAT